MMAELFQLTVRGTIAFLLVLGLEAIFADRMQAQGRRYWWIAVALAFLFPFKLSVLPGLSAGPSDVVSGLAAQPHLFGLLPDSSVLLPAATHALVPIGLIWGVGAIFFVTVLLWRTVATSRRWSTTRFCTEPALLDMLEDSKREAGVSAPVGLILTDEIATPAILGWLRPRILLPASKVRELEPTRLRHVFLHELVHFRSMDVPVGWLFALARCLHWFNPLAYCAERAWTRFREEAADEQTLHWSQGQSYGETLIALVPTEAQATLSGVLALSETFPNLKHRIRLIMNNRLRKPRPLLALLVLAALGSLIALQPSRAETDDKADALAATETWLQGIDTGNYATSWQDASAAFQAAITQGKWVQALTGVRTPLGKLLSRKVASSLHQTEVPSPSGMVKGDFVITQFDSSFENLKYAVETVTFEKDGGTWKASGYYIKPKL